MRIRNIKPEFWKSEDIKRLSREDRLLFVGLWSYVDDNGVGIDDYRQIAADLFPIEDDPIEVREFVRQGLLRISGGGLITRYELAGKPYLFINGWKHQKVYNANKARLPLPNGKLEHPSDDYVASTEGLGKFSGESRESLNPGENGQVLESSKHDGQPSTTYPQGSNLLLVTSGSVDPPETLGTGSGEQGNRGTEKKDLAPADAPADLFDAFWSEYPRKDGKAAAVKAWPKACKKLDPPRLVAAAKYWSGLWQRAGFEKGFIPHASTWLNGERWNDEPPTPRAPAKTNGHHVPWTNPTDQSVYDEELL